MVEEHAIIAIPFALHDHGRNRARVPIHVRPWKWQISSSQFRPFPASEGDSLHPDRTPSDRRAPGFAGEGDGRDIDGPASRDHMGLLAEVNHVAHPPAVEGNG